MMNEDGFRAAVAAGVIGADEAYGSLLRSIVEVARAIFNAQKSSIFLLDEETDELVFEALAGEEEQGLIGMRIPSSTGIAGWTLVTRQPLVIEDLTNDPRHARAVAEGTGYVPKGIMSVPLLADERALGVLQVLDRPHRPGFSLQEMELLGLFANQAAIALDLLQRSRRAKSALESGGSDVAVVARVAAALDELTEGDRTKAVRLFEAIEDVLVR
jgi:GAF domain-containing protein